MVFSLEQRIFTVKHYFETKSYKTVRNEFKNECPEHIEITDSSTQWLIKKFESTGTVRDLPIYGIKFKQTNEIKDKVGRLLKATPTISSRRLAKQVNALHSTTYRVMQKITYLYKIQFL